MDPEDPIAQFFPNQEHVDLYDVLSVPDNAKQDEIKKAYRRLALVYHPDKHATASPAARADASVKFQQIGFAYAVLSDEKRKRRYDTTGKTDEGFELAAGEDGWDVYFEAMFERVTHSKLDEMKKEYQGSTEELSDLKAAYTSTGGSIGEIMTHIPHSTYDDEGRFIIIISDLIAQGTLPVLKKWEETVEDEKAALVRKKQGQKEANEAEKLAKELGVWEEFYGDGTRGKRKGKGKGQEERDVDNEEDHSVLQALIVKKQKKVNGFLDSLAAKYAEPKRKEKKRARHDDPEEILPPKTKSRKVSQQKIPDINDEEFAELQEKIFGNKDREETSPLPKSKKGKTRKGKVK